MEKLTFDKNSFVMEKIKSLTEKYCAENNLRNDDVLKIQLVCEEFLTNILFPEFDKNVDFVIYRRDNATILTFEYEGRDFMNDVNDESFLALKILKNKTKSIKSETSGNKTSVKFEV